MDDKYQPVPHDAEFRSKLLAKTGVQEAFDALEAELLERDKNRDIGAELLESVHQMLRGETSVVPLPPTHGAASGVVIEPNAKPPR